MCTPNQLLKKNQEWAISQIEEKSDIFNQSAQGQSPKYLWIGCSDSRVPPNILTGTSMGSIFVHRNIANQIKVSDDNLNAILDYSINALKVSHVLVVGHSKCGGVKHALEGGSESPVGDWIESIKTMVSQLPASKDLDANQTLDYYCRQNVLAQAKTLSQHSIVTQAWDNGQDLAIHSWFYDLAKGSIECLEDPISQA